MDPRLTILCPILKKIHSICYHGIGKESKKHHWKYNKFFLHERCFAIFLQGSITLDQHLAKTKHNNSCQKENGKVMFHDLLPHSSIGETFYPIGINSKHHDKLSNVACEYASTN